MENANQSKQKQPSSAFPPQGFRRSNPSVSPRLRIQNSSRNKSQSRSSRSASVYDDIPQGIKPKRNTATYIKWKVPNKLHGRRQRATPFRDDGLGRRPVWSGEQDHAAPKLHAPAPLSQKAVPHSGIHPYGSPNVLLHRQPSVLNQPDDPSALVVQDWVERYTLAASYYTSDAVYCELKLKEVRRITARAGVPSRLRTAICADLLDKISTKLGPLSDLFCGLKDELYASIYADFNPDVGYPQAFMQASPYFLENKKLQKEIAELQLTVGGLNNNQTKSADVSKNRRIIDMYARKWLKQSLWKVFSNWAQYTKTQKAKRHQLLGALRRMQRRQVGLREIVWAWRLEAHKQRSSGLAVAAQRRKSLVNHQEMVWSAKLHEKEAEITRLKEENKALAKKVSNLEKQLYSSVMSPSSTPPEPSNPDQHGRQHLNILPSQGLSPTTATTDPHFARLTCEVLRCCLMLGVQAISFLGGTIAEIALTPTAHILAALLSTETSIFQDITIAPLPHEVLTSKVLGADEKIFDSVSKLRPDELLLHWANYHLQSIKVNGSPFKRQLLNFGGDLKDGEIYAALLHVVDSELGSLKLIIGEDNKYSRVRRLCDMLPRLKPYLPITLTADHIFNGNERMNVLFILQLFLRSNGFIDPKELFESEVESFQDIQTCWLSLQQNISKLLSHIEKGKAYDDMEVSVRCLDGLKLITKRIPRLSSQLETALTRTRLGNRVFHKMIKKMHEFYWTLNPPGDVGDTSQWGSNLPSPNSPQGRATATNLQSRISITNMRSKKIAEAFSAAEPQRFNDIYDRMGLDAPQKHSTHSNVMKCLQQNFEDTQLVFRYFTQGEEMMSLFQFWTWFHLSRIKAANWGKKVKVYSSDVDVVVARVLENQDSLIQPDLRARISLMQFSHMLVQLAALFDPPDQSTPLEATVGMFIQRAVNLLAQKIRMGEMQMNEFSVDFLKSQVQKVVLGYSQELLQCFQEYAQDREVPMRNLHAFFEDTTLHRDGVFDSEDEIKLVMMMRGEWTPKSQAETYNGDGLSFVEFIEVLTAACLCFKCNPYESLANRLEYFIQNKIVTLTTSRQNSLL